MVYYGRSGYGYRSGRRSYRRGYRRYNRYSTSLRRYRSVQLNDNETKVMTFTSVSTVSITPNAVSQVSNVFSALKLLSGPDAFPSVSPTAGRLFFAGMMFDRLRFRSISCTIRPRTMPNTTATNYTLYAAWDRYGSVESSPGSSGYSIQSDPSAKQVTWSSGGSGSPLRIYIYSTNRDRYQYFPIEHAGSLTSWEIPRGNASESYSSPFFPTLLLYIDAITAPDTAPSIQILTRATVEFQGGYSNNTLNYTPPAAVSGASLTRTVEDPLQSQDDDSSLMRFQQLVSQKTSRRK